MVTGLNNCASVKVTPSATSMLSVQNPTGVVPKIVHVYCSRSSDAYLQYGYAREMWIRPRYGVMLTTNGSTGANTSYIFMPVDQTPTEVQTFQFKTDELNISKGPGAITSRWNTNTEYTVEIYT